MRCLGTASWERWKREHIISQHLSASQTACYQLLEQAQIHFWGFFWPWEKKEGKKKKGSNLPCACITSSNKSIQAHSNFTHNFRLRARHFYPGYQEVLDGEPQWAVESHSYCRLHHKVSVLSLFTTSSPARKNNFLAWFLITQVTEPQREFRDNSSQCRPGPLKRLSFLC